MKRKTVVLAAGILVITTVAIFAFSTHLGSSPNTVSDSQAAAVGSLFTYSFKVPGILREAGTEKETTSPYWWVNSGGGMVLKDGTGMTLQGAASQLDSWRLLYLRNNPSDTDSGYHPQNLFRLVSRASWNDPSIQVSFLIVRDNLSDSTNRNESNGLLLMSRYALDGQTLYYAGIRVDGTAVIKKKYHGTYYTMAQKQVFPGRYDKATAPNLLPKGERVTLRSETTTTTDGTTVTLFMRRASETQWTQLLSAIDDGKKYGNTAQIDGPGRIGIRTDFMDVQFRDIRVEEKKR